MRPIKLKIKNVNSFLSEQEADFEYLGQDNIFCITGPVGSGKTTVLDCIILALYGTTSRCNNSEIVNVAETKAEIEYTFSEENNRYTVKRTFSKKGASKAELYLKDKLICDGVDTVNDYLLDLIGISMEDFTQVVILEQGKFAQFLKATPAKRNRTVAQLFKLDRFNDLGTRFTSLKTNLTYKAQVLEEKLKKYEDVTREIIIENNTKKTTLLNELSLYEARRLECEKTAREQLEKRRVFSLRQKLIAELNAFKSQIEPLNNAEILLKKKRAEISEKKQEKTERELALRECEKFLSETEKKAKAEEEINRLILEREELVKELVSYREQVKNNKEKLESAKQKRAEFLGGILFYKNKLESKITYRDSLIKAAQLLENEIEDFKEKSAAISIRKALKSGDTCPVCGGVFHGETLEENIEIIGKETKVKEIHETIKKLDGEIGETFFVLEQFSLNDFIDIIEKEDIKFNIKELAGCARQKSEEINLIKSSLNLLEEKINNVIEKGVSKKALIEEKRASLGFTSFASERQKKEAELKELKAYLIEFDKFEREVRESERKLEEEKIKLNENIKRLEKEISGGVKEFDEEFSRKLDEEIKKVNESINLIHSQLGIINSFLSTAEIRLSEKNETESEKKKINKTCDMADRLSKIFKGGKFSDFVSQDYILRFSDRASKLLFGLSNGRFSLSFDTVESEFLVTDYLSGGLTRKTKTLSGGETFLASVAVAASISELISNFTRNDFFFLDEGFGTLDSKSIGMVLSALKTLAKDVLVGLVSHRSELTEQIFMQLNVIPASEGEGSKLKII